MNAFDVYLDCEWIDTVFYLEEFTMEQVFLDLVHEGWDENIVVELREDKS